MYNLSGDSMKLEEFIPTLLELELTTSNSIFVETIENGIPCRFSPMRSNTDYEAFVYFVINSEDYYPKTVYFSIEDNKVTNILFARNPWAATKYPIPNISYPYDPNYFGPGNLSFVPGSIYSKDIDTGNKMIVFAYAVLYWIGVGGMIIDDVARIRCPDGSEAYISLVKILSGAHGYYEKYGAVMVNRDRELLDNYRHRHLQDIANEEALQYLADHDLDVHMTISELAKLSMSNCGLLRDFLDIVVKYNATTKKVLTMIRDQYKRFTHKDIDNLNIVFDTD